MNGSTCVIQSPAAKDGSLTFTNQETFDFDPRQKIRGVKGGCANADSTASEYCVSSVSFLGPTLDETIY